MLCFEMWNYASQATIFRGWIFARLDKYRISIPYLCSIHSLTWRYLHMCFMDVDSLYLILLGEPNCGLRAFQTMLWNWVSWDGMEPNSVVVVLKRLLCSHSRRLWNWLESWFSIFLTAVSVESCEPNNVLKIGWDDDDDGCGDLHFETSVAQLQRRAV